MDLDCLVHADAEEGFTGLQVLLLGGQQGQQISGVVAQHLFLAGTLDQLHGGDHQAVSFAADFPGFI